MKTETAQIRTKVDPVEPQLTLVPKSGYAEMWELAAEGIYLYKGNGTYYYRPLLPNRKRTYRSLRTKNLKFAKERYQNLCSHNGHVAENKLKVGEILDRYEEDGYLDENLENRPAGTEAEEKRHCLTLRKFWTEIRFQEVSDPNCDSYFLWRKRPENLKQGNGRRTTDRELNTLNNAFKYAKRLGLIRVNPLADRPRYQKSTSVKHCREFCPRNADELHEAATLLFQHQHSVVLGFQLLAESYSGLRTQEVLKWGEDNFGTTTPDAKNLYVWRLKGQHHNNPYCSNHEGLQAVLKAHAAWKKEYFPGSPWFFPSHCGGPVGKGALAHALRRLHKTGKLKRKLTSHGAGRGFYVLVRRSQGATDEAIAFEIGHSSNGACIKSTYGGIPDNWRNGGGPHLSWLPLKADLAWNTIPASKERVAEAAKP
jgi:hypothetical protein